MKRYFSSFFITLFIYLSGATTLVYVYNNNVISKKKIEEPTQKISLNHVQLEPMIKKTSIEQKEKKQEKELKKSITEKIQKKPEVKKTVKKIEKPRKKITPKTKPKKVVEKTTKESKQKEKKIVKEEVVKKEIVATTTKKVVNSMPKINPKQEFLNKHLAEIRTLINNNIKYPKRARKLRIQGLVTVKFKILKNGKLGEIQIIDGNKFLRKSTIDAIKNASVNFPKTITDIDIKIPISYKLY